MKRHAPSKRPALRPVTRRPGAGTAGSRRPTPGWKGSRTRPVGWRNPRTPSVPATLDLTLDDYFTATSLMGLIASQDEEPNQQWCRDWSFKMGRMMAAEARRRRRTRA